MKALLIVLCALAFAAWIALRLAEQQLATAPKADSDSPATTPQIKQKLEQMQTEILHRPGQLDQALQQTENQ